MKRNQKPHSPKVSKHVSPAKTEASAPLTSPIATSADASASLLSGSAQAGASAPLRPTPPTLPTTQAPLPSDVSTEEIHVSYPFLFTTTAFLLLASWLLVTVFTRSSASKEHHKKLVPAAITQMSLPPALSSSVQPSFALSTFGEPLPSQRSLQVYYQRRAYPGAPPQVPHPLVESQGQSEACLSCHSQGGYVPKYEAYAPVTPHPTWENCVQCHVPKRTPTFFRPTGWTAPRPPKLQRSSLPGSPPPIPHSLQTRTACNTCHDGPSAVKEIRTPHPERSNCLQCHVPRQEVAPFRSAFAPVLKASSRKGPSSP